VNGRRLSLHLSVVAVPACLTQSLRKNKNEIATLQIEANEQKSNRDNTRLESSGIVRGFFVAVAHVQPPLLIQINELKL
jgi:hypothetical protein